MKIRFAALLLVATAAFAADSPNLQMQTRIRQEGFRNSKVMEIAEVLTDVIGGRLTGSPQMKRANEWTRDELTKFGLVNSHLEPWGPFGKGWSQEYVNVRMTAPDVAPLIAYPQAWTPGTNGAVRGKVVAVKIEKFEDTEKYKGTLAGPVVLLGEMRDVKPHLDAELRRFDEKGLEDVAH